MEKEIKKTENNAEAQELLDEYVRQADTAGKHSYSENWHSQDASDGCCC